MVIVLRHSCLPNGKNNKVKHILRETKLVYAASREAHVGCFEI